MNSSSRFRWFIAVVLVLSVGWKIAIPPDNQSYLKERLVDFFERNHFNVVVTDEMINYTPIIHATTTSCRLQVASLTSDGSNRDLIRDRSSDADRSFVVFRGTVYASQPIVWTTLDYFWFRFLRELGFVSHIPPVINVAENSACNAEHLAWGDL